LVDSGKVSGLIVTRALSEDPRIEFLLEIGMPFVVHGRSRDPSRYAWLDIDNEKAASDAVVHLAGLGHTRIALVCASPGFNFSRLRLDGYRAGIRTAGLPESPAYVRETSLSAEGGYEAMQTLLTLEERPTAIVCVTDLVAIGVMKATREAGLKIGTDLSVIGYDGLPFGAFTDPPLTTMGQDVMRTGRRLTEILLEVQDGADPTDFQEIWNAHLIRRATDRPPA
jgi:LacI family transcriptional regulator